ELDGLRLPHQGDVAGRGFVPAGGHANKRLMNLLGRQPHRVVERPVRGTLRAFSGMPTGQPRLQIGFRVHRTLRAYKAPSPPSPSALKAACREPGRAAAGLLTPDRRSAY